MVTFTAVSREALFYSKVAVGTPEECWEWQGYRDGDGYGRFIPVSKRQWLAHRWAWKLAYGDIPPSLCVCHRCDNPSCCNPSHLFLGTNQENTADRVAKGRSARGERVRAKNQARGARHGRYTHPEQTARGSRGGLAKITEADALAIRERYAAGGISSLQLAAEYGLAKKVILDILHGRTWKHVGGPLLTTEGPRIGEQNNKAKLTADDVRTIRREYAAGVSQRELMVRYNVSCYAIYAIVQRLTWKHID